MLLIKLAIDVALLCSAVVPASALAHRAVYTGAEPHGTHVLRVSQLQALDYDAKLVAVLGNASNPVAKNDSLLEVVRAIGKRWRET